MRRFTKSLTAESLLSSYFPLELTHADQLFNYAEKV